MDDDNKEKKKLPPPLFVVGTTSGIDKNDEAMKKKMKMIEEERNKEDKRSSNTESTFLSTSLGSMADTAISFLHDLADRPRQESMYNSLTSSPTNKMTMQIPPPPALLDSVTTTPMANTTPTANRMSSASSLGSAINIQPTALERNELMQRPVGAYRARPGGYIRSATTASSVQQQDSMRSMRSSLNNNSDRTTPTVRYDRAVAASGVQDVTTAILVDEDSDLEQRVQDRLNQMVSTRAVVVVKENNDKKHDDDDDCCFKVRKRWLLLLLSVIALLLIFISIPIIVTTTKKQEDNNNNNNNIIPTLGTLVPTQRVVGREAVSIFLQFGNSSNGIGYDLYCGQAGTSTIQNLIERRRPGAWPGAAYKMTTSVIRNLPVGQQCIVQLINIENTGLEPNGTLQVYQGVPRMRDRTEDKRLAEISQFIQFTTDVYSNVFQVDSIASSIPTTTMAPTSSEPMSVPSSQPFLQNTPQPIIISPSPFISPPVESSYPTFDSTIVQMIIKITLQLDKYPTETGWILLSNTVPLQSVEPGTYNSNNTKGFIQVSIPIYDEYQYYQFKVVDTAYDGICCGGYIRLSAYYPEDTNKPVWTQKWDGASFSYAKHVDFIPNSGINNVFNENEPTTGVPFQEKKWILRITIQLDDFPIETGWSLTCSRNQAFSSEAGNYLDNTEPIQITHSLYKNSHCYFTITDEAGDGLKGDGNFKLSVVSSASGYSSNNDNPSLWTYNNTHFTEKGSRVEFYMNAKGVLNVMDW